MLHALTAAKPKVRYAVSPQPVQDFLARRLPKRVVDRLIGGRLGLLPQKSKRSPPSGERSLQKLHMGSEVLVDAETILRHISFHGNR